MRDLSAARRRRSRRSTVAGSAAIPGLVDCHTHACFAGDRVEEFSLRAGGRVVRGAPRARRRHPLDRAGDASCGRGRPRRAARRARRLDAPGGHDDLRGEVRVRARPRDRARAAPGGSRTRAASRPGSARTRFRRSSRTRAPTRTSTSSSARCLPEAARSPRPPTSSSSAARSTPSRHAAT